MLYQSSSYELMIQNDPLPHGRFYQEIKYRNIIYCLQLCQGFVCAILTFAEGKIDYILSNNTI